MPDRDLKLGLSFMLCMSAFLLAGCNDVRVPGLTHSGAPALGEDAPSGVRGGTNPNAPYTMVDHRAHLVERPTLIDINAAQPCQASDLTLFESGARVDGDRRSVRLNLVNHALAPCRLGGYPAISLLRQDGSVLGNVRIEKVTAVTLEANVSPDTRPSNAALPAVGDTQIPLPSPMVLLAPAGEAAFEVGWTSGQNGVQCDQVGSIVISAPGTTQSFTVRHEMSMCEGRILVTAISDGTQL